MFCGLDRHSKLKSFVIFSYFSSQIDNKKKIFTSGISKAVTTYFCKCEVLQRKQ